MRAATSLLCSLLSVTVVGQICVGSGLSVGRWRQVTCLWLQSCCESTGFPHQLVLLILSFVLSKASVCVPYRSLSYWLESKITRGKYPEPHWSLSLGFNEVWLRGRKQRKWYCKRESLPKKSNSHIIYSPSRHDFLSSDNKNDFFRKINHLCEYNAIEWVPLVWCVEKPHTVIVMNPYDHSVFWSQTVCEKNTHICNFFLTINHCFQSAVMWVFTKRMLWQVT